MEGVKKPASVDQGRNVFGIFLSKIAKRQKTNTLF